MGGWAVAQSDSPSCLLKQAPGLWCHQESHAFFTFTLLQQQIGISGCVLIAFECGRANNYEVIFHGFANGRKQIFNFFFTNLAPKDSPLKYCGVGRNNLGTDVTVA